MQELATSHWKNNDTKTSTNCRIKWIKNQCHNYFFNDGKIKFFSREKQIQEKMNDLPKNKDNELPFYLPQIGKINLLDVGSCYNPFDDDDNFEVTPIDLVPYSNKVYQCDFLNVDLGQEKITGDNDEKIIQLKVSSFDVVVFSLLLEYFPSPDQRFNCCQKAYDVLKSGGILIIITPDSKHVNANANIMKSWRFVLSKMGFMRICYEKLEHIHCITYRKCFDKKVASRWADMQIIQKDNHLFKSTNKIFIPQDFNSNLLTKNYDDKIIYNVEDMISGFDQLPQYF